MRYVVRHLDRGLVIAAAIVSLVWMFFHKQPEAVVVSSFDDNYYVRYWDEVAIMPTKQDMKPEDVSNCGRFNCDGHN
jgi:hypothetical protein